MESTLTGLDLARHVLMRLVDNHEGIERVTEDFDNDTRFILGVIDFLKDVKWIEQDLSGSYQITEKGKSIFENNL
jgi:predicted transcriptional regulator